ncbi:MAG: 7-carboxy-7-deazaguanine synthase QueE [Terrimicrobiaceae bacterium]
MLISEIFYSVQGEGELTGVPSVFIRTSGCNLRCRWCDTPYASWNPEGTEMSVAQILAEVEKHPAAHVVLTGGEPMVARGIHELAAALRALGKHITIETAGTVTPGGIACDLASISPKLADSTPAPGSIEPAWIERHEKSRCRPEILREWLTAYPFQLKFVVSSEADLPEIHALLAATGHPVSPSKILLMPEGTDPATIDSRCDMLVGLCLRHGHRLCDRLHIRLFGNTRGT